MHRHRHLERWAVRRLRVHPPRQTPAARRRRIAPGWPCKGDAVSTGPVHATRKRCSPEIDTDTVDVGRRKEVAGRRERQAGRHCSGSERVDELSSRDVEGTDHRVLRGRHDPPRVGREGLSGGGFLVSRCSGSVLARQNSRYRGSDLADRSALAPRAGFRCRRCAGRGHRRSLRAGRCPVAAGCWSRRP